MRKRFRLRRTSLRPLLERASHEWMQVVDPIELAKTGTPQQIQAAINQGADVNARGKYGRTRLMFAAGWNQNPGAITTLLKAGAAIDAQDFCGRTALMLAAEGNQNPEVIIILLKAGAEAKIKDSMVYLGV